MERGISKKLFSAFVVVFLVILLWLFINIVVKQQEYRVLSLISAILIFFVIFLITKGTRTKIDSISKKKFFLLMLFLFILFTALLVTAGYLLTQVLIMDLKVVYESIPDFLDNMVMDRYSHYYVVCNNNVGLMLLLSGFFKVISVLGISPITETGTTAAILFNAFMIVLSVLFIVLSARKIYTANSSVFIVFLICFFCPVFYIWTPIFYSDTLSMPFISATFYIYILSRESKTYLKRILLILLATIVAFLGFAVKGSVAVIIVAIVIDVIIDRRENILRTISLAVVVIMTFSLLYLSYTSWQRKSGVIDFSVEETAGLPLGLWFLYGSHLPGYYSEDDLQYCISFDTLNERKEAVNARIKENYSSYTAIGYISMATEKAVMTWKDGKFGADPFLCTPYRVNFTHQIILEGKPLYVPYTLYAQGYHLMILAILCYGLFRRIRISSRTDLNIVYLTIFGTMLFFNFWETTSRYIINILPLLCLTVANEIRKKER